MRQLLTTLLLALAAGSAAADAPTRFALSGFGTLGVVRSDKDDYHFRSSGTQSANSPGQNFDPSVDSVLGIQGTGRLHDQLDLTVQAISRQATGYNYTPHITWAYLRYRATPALTVRVGRTTTPFFMFSDSLNLNYATPWVRPPSEVYNLNPFSDLDGIDLLYRIPLGEMDLEIQGLFGNSAVSARSASTRLKNAKGINFGLVGSGFSAHAGYARTRLELQWDDGFYRALSNLLTALDEKAALAELSGTKGTTEFFSAGFQWEKNNWLTIAEFAKRIKALGCDFIHVSSGGVSPAQKIALGAGYQVPFARDIRQASGLPTIAVGLITEAQQAETVLQAGEADLVALARAFLYEPRWGWHAAAALGGEVQAKENYWRCLPREVQAVFGKVSVGMR